jgi:hypothetical protein
MGRVGSNGAMVACAGGVADGEPIAVSAAA